jgi:muramoyltetrapeptide carboxypeptidase
MSAATLTVFSPAGVVRDPKAITRAVRRLRTLGFEAAADESALARHQRFAGDDDTRLAALHRVARSQPAVALASRGGYGLTRLLDQVDWKLLARSVAAGTRWVGHSDLTTLQLGLLAHARGCVTWAGPLAAEHFGRTESGFDGLDVKGLLWGGNLSVLLSLLGTPHWPRVKGGILFVEDVNEHPYRIERGLLQLAQAGVLDAQRAVLLGAFSNFKPAPHDRGYNLKTAVERVRAATRTPVLTGLPHGHVPMTVCLPVGARVTLATQGREAYIGW